jgi:hypothetical protein
MRVIARSTLVTAVAAIVIAGGLSSSASAATGTTTLTLTCFTGDRTQVPITDVQTSRTVGNGLVLVTDALTAPNGTSLTYTSIYRHFSDEFASWISGPKILDVGELEGGIDYLQGSATLFFSGGGYTASFTANRVTDVCAALGYSSA